MLTADNPVEAYREFTFQVEPMVVALAGGLRELHQAHFAETEQFRASEGCNPDYDRYMKLEAQGSFLLFTVRDADYKLVGDAMVMVQRNRHTQKLSSYEDALYLAPEARKGWTAVRFLRFIERYLVGLGVTQLAFGCKLTNDISAVYERCGFKPTAKVFSKVVSNDQSL
jgi:GNAT superfamily N-acetyltransferase